MQEHQVHQQQHDDFVACANERQEQKQMIYQQVSSNHINCLKVTEVVVWQNPFNDVTEVCGEGVSDTVQQSNEHLVWRILKQRVFEVLSLIYRDLFSFWAQFSCEIE